MFSRLSSKLHLQERAVWLSICGLGVLLLVAATLIASPPVKARSEFYAAGVMLIAHKDENTYILLGKPHVRPWYEFFGGRRGTVTTEDGQRRPETAYETAVRESYEESRGYLSLEFLRGAVKEDGFLIDGGFVYFRCVIEPFPLDAMRGIPIPQSDFPLAYSEIADYVWVNVAAVTADHDALVVDETGRRIKVRPQLHGRVMQAKQAGWFERANK